MKMPDTICPGCCAQMKIDQEKGIAFCEYCGCGL